MVTLSKGLDNLSPIDSRMVYPSRIYTNSSSLKIDSITQGMSSTSTDPIEGLIENTKRTKKKEGEGRKIRKETHHFHHSNPHDNSRLPWQ